MPRIKTNHPYTFQELELMRNDPNLASLALKGYYLRHNLDDTVSFVHDSTVNARRGPVTTEVDWGLDPIVKRTPQQRRDSMVRNWFEECKRAGTVPGLSDAKVSEILGEDWVTGTSEMTVEVVERLAAAMLQDAENKKSHADYKKVTVNDS